MKVSHVNCQPKRGVEFGCVIFVQQEINGCRQALVPCLTFFSLISDCIRIRAFMIVTVVYTFKTVAQSFDFPDRPRHLRQICFLSFAFRFGGFDTRKFYLFCQQELALQPIHIARPRFHARSYVVECSCDSVRCTKQTRCIDATSLQSIYSILNTHSLLRCRV